MDIQTLHDQMIHTDLSGVVKKTPLDLATQLSKSLNNLIYMKREDTQTIFSFKIRGAYNKIKQLSNHQKNKGIIASSAGNHAQGVALAAKELNIHATIVMPQTTPSIKVDAVKRLGASVILFGDTYDDAFLHAQQLSKQHNYTFIHPYDDPDVIVGQGTLGIEMIQQLSEPIDYLFVSVGGGGLLAGLICAFSVLSPKTKIIAVEPQDSNCLQQALAADEPVLLPAVGLFADGVAVKQIGELPFSIIQNRVDDSICVSTDQICAAIKDIYEETRTIPEPAGALSLAGAKQYLRAHSIQNQNVVTITCGANMNFDRLRHVAERTQISENNEILMSVEIPEEPGALLTFCTLLGKRTITEFNYRFQSNKKAVIFVGVENTPELPDVIEQFQLEGYRFKDLSSNECAKIHIRYMVGGMPTHPIQTEKVFRFQFPERPGALYEFLTGLKNKWNITMFHYRNHGAAYGRVLVGFNVPEKTQEDFYQLLSTTAFPFVEETDNVAIQAFLKNE